MNPYRNALVVNRKIRVPVQKIIRRFYIRLQTFLRGRLKRTLTSCCYAPFGKPNRTWFHYTRTNSNCPLCNGHVKLL